jgi:hypothetical protein
MLYYVTTLMNRQNDTKNYLRDATCQIHPLHPLTTLQENNIDIADQYIFDKTGTIITNN